MNPTLYALVALLLSLGMLSSCGQETKKPENNAAPTAADARRALEEFARAVAAGDAAAAKARVKGSEPAMRLLESLCNFKRASAAFSEKLTSVHGTEAAKRFPRCGEFLLVTAIFTLDGPMLLIFVDPDRVKEVGCETTDEGHFLTARGDRIARLVSSGDGWKMNLDSAGTHTSVMAAGFDGLARIYAQLQSKIDSPGPTPQQLRADIDAAFRSDVAVQTLQDAATRAGFQKGMPMP